MDIFSIISLLGGLALFLYGMTVMSQGLEKLAGGKLEAILRSMTSNKYKGLFLGVGVTAVIQSSSAVTVMLVGLVNSGIMSLEQSVGVIMGSNIGTTITAWILSLIGVTSDNILIQMLNPNAFSPIVALIGVMLMLGSKSNKKKDTGTVMIGFALLMYGMSFMSDAMAPLQDMPEFTQILTAFNNPLLGIMVGMMFTAIIQSSSASVGILQALSLTSGITYGMAIPIIMGQNIGTCITVLISSIGVNKSAKRVATVHVAFNVIGTIVCIFLFYSAQALWSFDFVDNIVSPVDIAIIHTTFNLLTTTLLFPFNKQLVKLSQRVVKDTDTEERDKFLDKRLLNTPSVALQEASEKTKDMARISFDNLNASIDILHNYTPDKFKEIKNQEKTIDYYEDKLGSFLVKISANDLSDKDSAIITKMLHTIGDVERIGDHALNIAESAQELYEKNIRFSAEAKHELDVLTSALKETLEHTFIAYAENDIEEALLVEPIEEVTDDLVEEIKINHIRRLKEKECTIELGFVLSDILTNMERVSDHCSNIAVTLIELSHNHFKTHEYKRHIKSQEDRNFAELYSKYSEKYYI